MTPSSILKHAVFMSLAMIGMTSSATPAHRTGTSTVAAASPTSATSVDAKTAAMIKATLQQIAPTASLDHISKTTMPGIYLVETDGHVIYVSKDARFVIQGDIFDVQTGHDFTEDRMKMLRKKALAAVPKADRIIFAPPHPKYTVNAFVDIDCGYCQHFHKSIAEINKLGIAVQYIAFPRNGLGTPSFFKAAAVWCSSDRQKAFTAAMEGEKTKAGTTCLSMVQQEYEAGTRIGVPGTPTLVAPDGSLIGGYMTPDALLAALKRDAAHPSAY